MSFKKNLISLYFFLIIIFEFCIFFYFNFFGYQIKLARFLQLIFILFSIPYILYENIILKTKNFFLRFNNLDLFFFIFFVYLILNSIFFYYFNNDINDIYPQFLEISKYLFYYIIYIFIVRQFEHKINLFLIYKLLYFSVYFILAIGLFEFTFNFFTDNNFIPRQFNYGFDDEYIGLRFHSLLGEPRDASVNLLAFSSIIILLEIFFYSRIRSYFLIFLIFTSSILTFSTTLIFCFALIGITYIILCRNLINIIFMIIFCSTLVLAIFYLDQRVYQYLSDLFMISNYINNLEVLKTLQIEPQLINIMPIYIFLNDLINLNFLEFFFGNGLSSSSNISYKSYFNFSDYPHSQLSRLVYELGIVGLISYIFLLNYYKKFLSNVFSNNSQIILIVFIVFLSAALAHRTGIFLIFLSLTQLIYINKKYDIHN